MRPFEFGLVKRGRRPEVVDHADHPAPDRDVPHELRRPCVDLFVTLVREPGPVLPWIGREAGVCHGPEYRRSTGLSWAVRRPVARRPANR